MATALPYIQGTRRTSPQIMGDAVMPGESAGAGTAALIDDPELNRLLTLLQSFYTPGPMDAVADAVIQNANEMAGPGTSPDSALSSTPASPNQLNPEIFSTASTVLGPLAQLTNSEELGMMANMSNLAGRLANADPTTALTTMGMNFANLAGANPIVTSGINAIIGAARDPVDYTPQDIAGKILDIALSATPLNFISNVLTGKTIGGQLKGALTPVTEAVPGGNVSDLLAQQANTMAKETATDPLDALMSITNAFGTAPAAQETSTPGMQLADLASSMIGMKADPETAAVAFDTAVSQASQSSAAAPGTGIAGLGLDLGFDSGMSPGFDGWGSDGGDGLT